MIRCGFLRVFHYVLISGEPRLMFLSVFSKCRPRASAHYPRIIFKITPTIPSRNCLPHTFSYFGNTWQRTTKTVIKTRKLDVLMALCFQKAHAYFFLYEFQIWFVVSSKTWRRYVFLPIKVRNFCSKSENIVNYISIPPLPPKMLKQKVCEISCNQT